MGAHDRFDLRIVTESGSERASCLDRPAQPEGTPSLATDATARPAVLRTMRCAETRSRGARAEAPVLPRQCAARRSPIRAGARARRSARPSGRAWAVSPARTTWRSSSRPRLGLDHVADAAPRLHEMVDLAPPGHQPPRRMFQRSPASSPQYAAGGVLGARAHLSAARNLLQDRDSLGDPRGLMGPPGLPVRRKAGPSRPARRSGSRRDGACTEYPAAART